MLKKKIALIFGVTGQDGAYLSKFLLKKNVLIDYIGGCCKIPYRFYFLSNFFDLSPSV